MDYELLLKSYKGLVEKENNFTATLANTSAFIFNTIKLTSHYH